MTIINAKEWDIFLQQYPNHHFLQSSKWGEFKAKFGWHVFRVSNLTAGCQVLFRKFPFGFTIGYIPKGPVGTNWELLWPEIDLLCIKQKTIYLIIELDSFERQESKHIHQLDGFIESSECIQPRRTIVVDINKDEEEILQNMKQKTRYNINLAAKKEIMICASNDIAVFDYLMKKTGSRDGFGIHNYAYYSSVFSMFNPAGNCQLFLATYCGQPLAAIMVFFQGERAWYLYGASSDEERNRMPAYLLQWEAIKWAKAQGCKEYDLWGIPDCDLEQLESQFEKRSDGLWGVYRFKRGFGGQVLRTSAPKVKIFKQLLYRIIRRMRGVRTEPFS